MGVADLKFKTGDLLEVSLKDGRKYKCIVAERYSPAFICNVISGDNLDFLIPSSVFGITESCRFQRFDTCKSIKVLSESVRSDTTNDLRLNEELINQRNVTFYETDLGNGETSTICLCDGYYGWSFNGRGQRMQGLSESYLKAQSSKSENLTE